MENTKTSFGKALFAVILVFVELAFFSLFDNLIIWVTNKLPRMFEEIVSGSITIGGLFGINYWIINTISVKFPFFSSKITHLFKKWWCVIIIVVSISVIITSFAFKLIHITNDTTIPTITSTKPENTIVKNNQFDLPVVYHIFFDDETGLKEVLFDESYVDLKDCTANVTVLKINDGDCFLSLTNISGRSGLHQISIKQGAAKDTSNNLSKELLLSPFYLYDTKEDIDSESPLLNISDIPQRITENEVVEFKVSITDNGELRSTRLVEKDIILDGFFADIGIEKHLNEYTVRFNNIKVNASNGKCGFIIVTGIGKDTWGNESDSYISEDFYITSE